MRAELRPVEPAAARHEDEEVVVRTAADDDRAKERTKVDALALGTLLGASRRLGHDDAMRDLGLPECPHRGRGIVQLRPPSVRSARAASAAARGAYRSVVRAPGPSTGPGPGRPSGRHAESRVIER